MTPTPPGKIKGLFYHLVRSAGGVEAAASVMGVSHQRVSQLQSMNCADLPTILHIVALEHFVGEPIVTRALAEAITGPRPATDLHVESCEATEAAADLQKLVRSGADLKTIRAAAIRLEQETRDVTAAIIRAD